MQEIADLQKVHHYAKVTTICMWLSFLGITVLVAFIYSILWIAASCKLIRSRSTQLCLSIITFVCLPIGIILGIIGCVSANSEIRRLEALEQNALEQFVNGSQPYGPMGYNGY